MEKADSRMGKERQAEAPYLEANIQQKNAKPYPVPQAPLTSPSLDTEIS